MNSYLMLYGSNRPRRKILYCEKKKKSWPIAAIDHYAPWHFAGIVSF